MSYAEVTKHGFFDMQVCVPKEWENDKVKVFADEENVCGTENGWSIREEGDEMLGGDPERQACASRHGYIHIMLDA